MLKESKLNNVLIEYIRNNNRTKKGMLISGVHPDTGEVCIGWSLCRKTEKFDKNNEVAINRALKNERMEKYTTGDDIFDLFEIIPFSVLDVMPDFLCKMEKYYKNNKISAVVGYLMDELFEWREEIVAEMIDAGSRAVGDEADDPYYDPDFDERNEDDEDIKPANQDIKEDDEDVKPANQDIKEEKWQII